MLMPAMSEKGRQGDVGDETSDLLDTERGGTGSTPRAVKTVALGLRS